MRNIYIGIAVILIVIVGIFVFVQYRAGKNTQTASACDGAPVATSSATIVYSNGGFSPAVSSITAGGTLTVKNESGDAIQVDSNPHPIHTDDSDLNVGQIAAGEQQNVTVNKTGCFGYHNHLNPSETGKILIK